MRYGGRVSLRQTAMGLARLRPTLLAIGAIAPPIDGFGPEKLINSAIFAAGGNNTLELISN